MGIVTTETLTSPRAPVRRAWTGVHKALADPLRVQLLEALWEGPRSARELADCALLPADRLYYHLRQLEAAGLVEVVEYRPRARGKVERIYAPAAAEPPGDAASPEEMTAFLGSMLEATRADIGALFRAKKEGQRREVYLHRGAVRLNDAARAELRSFLEELARRYSGDDGTGPWTRVLLALVDLEDRMPPNDPSSEGRPS